MRHFFRGLFAVAVATAVVVSVVAVVSLADVSATAASTQAITFRSASSGSNATAASVTIPRPTGVVAGDVMVASVDGRGNPSFVAPAGWTLIRLDISGTLQRKGTYYKVAGAAEPDTYTWTWTGAQAAAGGILAYANVDPVLPIDTHSGAANSASSTASIVAPSVTTSTDGSVIIGLFTAATNTSITPPGGTTERFEAVSNAGRYPVVSEGADEVLPTAGASGDRTATAAVKGKGIGQLVALRPAQSPTPSPTPTPTSTATPTSTPTPTPTPTPTTTATPTPTPTPTTTPPPGDPVIAVDGDIACDPNSSAFNGGAGTLTQCRQRYTSDLVVAGNYAAVLPVGDLQYDNGSLADFGQSYGPSWGRAKSITHPVPGNHEYNTAGAAGYYDYFGSAAGDRTKGYYSYDVGSWHVVALNSNCAAVPCGAGSAQEVWLRADLAAHQNTCTLAYWHHPLFTSGPNGSGISQAFWNALYDFNADVVLVGHDHIYERFAPQTPAGVADATRGIRQFTVGVGGKDFHSIGSPKPNSEARQNSTYGILELTLHPTGYGWRFVPEAGATYSDTGSANCSGPPAPPTDPPTADPLAASTAEDTPTVVTLSGHDVQTCELTFAIVAPPAHGTLGAMTNNACSAGPMNDTASVPYTPSPNYNGPDSFTYRVTDGGGAPSTAAAVSLSITPVPDPPVALNDSYSTPPGQQLSVATPGVRLNDSDPDGDTLTAALATGPANGSLTLNADGSFTYTPAPSFSGADTFTYRAWDGLSYSSPATVSISVSGAAAPILFRSSSSAVLASGLALTIPKPSVLAPGDVMVASIDARGNPTFTAPLGWALIRLDVSGFTHRKATYFKVATSSEPASYTWTWTGAQAASGGIAAYANVDPLSPIAAHSGAASATNTSVSIRAPSITTTEDGAMLLGLFSMAQNATVAQPPGTIERFDVVSNLGTYPILSEGADETQPTAGATGDRLATASRTGWSIGQLIALRRAPPPP